LTGSIDTGLEFFRQVLELRGVRQEILSADIANASTPGFKAVDLDFAQALSAANTRHPPLGEASRAGRLWLVDDPRQIALDRGAGANGVLAAVADAVKYQTGNPVTLDGNSVNLDQEKVAAAENGVQYEAAATFASQTIKMLLTAINGSGSQQQSGA
jgi:flagellar basal-body rod protein FlgB